MLCKDLQDELEDLKLALSEFQSSSKELEDEMEKELANTERRETELQHEAERLRNDVEAWKVRLGYYTVCLCVLIVPRVVVGRAAIKTPSRTTRRLCSTCNKNWNAFGGLKRL